MRLHFKELKLCKELKMSKYRSCDTQCIYMQCRRPQFYSWVKKFPWRRDRLLTAVFLVVHGGSDSRESTCNLGDLGLIPGLGRFPGGGHGNPLQYSCLENPYGQRSLVGYSLWGHRELETNDWATKQSTARGRWPRTGGMRWEQAQRLAP